jgi:phage terminase small subunit
MSFRTTDIKMPALTNHRHEKFVMLMFEGRSVTAAYEEAGFAPDPANAQRLRRNSKIKTRLAELQAQAAEKAEISVGSLLAELEQARLESTNLKQLSATVRAIEAKAKVSGLLIQRTEVGSPGEFNSCQTVEQVVKAMKSELISDQQMTKEQLDQLDLMLHDWQTLSERIYDFCRPKRVISPPKGLKVISHRPSNANSQAT